MSDLRVLRHLFAGFQPYVGLFPVRAVTGEAAAAAQLADDVHSANLGHLHAEQLLDRGLDFGLVGLRGYLEAQRALLVLLRYAFFGDDGPLQYLINVHYAAPFFVSASESLSLRAAASDSST